ncbi:MAG: hypothetical protein R3C05_20120 [Pirellulaceae bacterium]
MPLPLVAKASVDICVVVPVAWTDSMTVVPESSSTVAPAVVPVTVRLASYYW